MCLALSQIGRARLPRSTLHAEARRNASSPLLASWRRQNGAMYGGPTTFPAGHPPRGLRYGGALLLLITGLHAFSGPLLGVSLLESPRSDNERAQPAGPSTAVLLSIHLGHGSVRPSVNS
eukprot:scaffold6423_cov33-Tisochrysis_lutea.AAC.3